MDAARRRKEDLVNLPCRSDGESEEKGKEYVIRTETAPNSAKIEMAGARVLVNNSLLLLQAISASVHLSALHSPTEI